jgi:hypothetical protein
MANVVYVLGAGFNCSLLDPSRGLEAPLATNFFQLLVSRGRPREKLEMIKSRLYVDLLFAEIERFWHLNIDALATTPFDVEECLTMFESQLLDSPSAELATTLHRADYALRNLMLMYLSDLSHHGHTPTAYAFGHEVNASGADVLTFNYDTVAEEAIELTSGIGDKPQPAARPQPPSFEWDVSVDDVDASHHSWNRGLAYGFQFDRVTLPIAGSPPTISGDIFYGHPRNRLYEQRRVLKLHGSINWLRSSGVRAMPQWEGMPDSPQPEGIVLDQYTNYWMGEPPRSGPWYMESVVIPPYLYKKFQDDPFRTVWKTALETLSNCETLVVIGYSFPATDFRTRRLFLEAFSDHALRNLVVVNPDARILGTVRSLTHFTGPAVSCQDLKSLYGLPDSWFDYASTVASTVSPPSVSVDPTADGQDTPAAEVGRDVGEEEPESS